MKNYGLSSVVVALSLSLALPCNGDEFPLGDEFLTQVGTSVEACSNYSQQFQRNTIEERVDDDVNCAGRYCLYVPKNPQKRLLNAVKLSVYTTSGNPFTEYDGYIKESIGEQKGIEFFDERPCKLAKVIWRIKQLDRKVIVRDPEPVTVRVDIYAVSESTLREFSIGASGIFDGIIDEGTAKGIIDTSGSGSSGAVNVAFGNLSSNMLQVHLRSGMEQNRVSEIETIEQTGEQCVREPTKRQSKAYRDGVTDTESEALGWSLQARPCLVEGRDRSIRFDGMSLSYSIPQEGSENKIADVVSMNRSFLVEHGRPYILLGNTKEMELQGKGKGLFRRSKRNGQSQTKLVAVLTAYIPHIKEKSRPFRELNSPQVDRLPDSMTVNESLTELAHAARFEIVHDEFRRIKVVRLYFEGDLQDLIAQNSYRERIVVSIEAKSYGRKPKKYFMQLQHIVLGGFQFPVGLTQVSFSDPVNLNFSVQRESAKGDADKVSFNLRAYPMEETVVVEKTTIYRAKK